MNRERDISGKKKPVDSADMFELSPGSSIGDFATALCAIARCICWPVRGQFNSEILTAYEHSDPADLICTYFHLHICSTRQSNNPN